MRARNVVIKVLIFDEERGLVAFGGVGWKNVNIKIIYFSQKRRKMRKLKLELVFCDVFQ